MDNTSLAWEKAQEALKKINSSIQQHLIQSPANTSSQPQPNPIALPPHMFSNNNFQQYQQQMLYNTSWSNPPPPPPNEPTDKGKMILNDIKKIPTPAIPTDSQSACVDNTSTFNGYNGNTWHYPYVPENSYTGNYDRMRNSDGSNIQDTNCHTNSEHTLEYLGNNSYNNSQMTFNQSNETIHQNYTDFNQKFQRANNPSFGQEFQHGNNYGQGFRPRLTPRFNGQRSQPPFLSNENSARPPTFANESENFDFYEQEPEDNEDIALPITPRQFGTSFSQQSWHNKTRFFNRSNRPLGPPSGKNIRFNIKSKYPVPTFASPTFRPDNNNFMEDNSWNNENSASRQAQQQLHTNSPNPSNLTPNSKIITKDENVTDGKKEYTASAGAWPPSLKRFVQRCFESVAEEEKNDMQAVLREYITSLFSNNLPLTDDYDNRPVLKLSANDYDMRNLNKVVPAVNGVHIGTWTPKPTFIQQENSSRGRGNEGRGNQFTHQKRGGRVGGGGMRQKYARDEETDSNSYKRRSESRRSPKSRSPSFRRSNKLRSPQRNRTRRKKSSSSTSSSASSRSDLSSRGSSSNYATNKKRRNRNFDRNQSPIANTKFKSRLGNIISPKKLRNGLKTPTNRLKDRMSQNIDYDVNDDPNDFIPLAKNKKQKFKFVKRDNFVVEHDDGRMNARATRFADMLSTRTEPLVLNINQESNSIDELDWSTLHIIGTCSNLEKSYFRLTTAPDASIVRPVGVLQQSIKLVEEKWKIGKDYNYICEQLKSIRQDLTVQGIRDSFTVRVYEMHARIAIEKGDHEEFNQCQTQLKALYNEGIKGCQYEFIAYRILYYIFTTNTTDIMTCLASLTASHRKNVSIKHAIETAHSWLLSNYVLFFRHYKNAPDMSAFILNWIIERERKTAVKLVVKAYRPNIPVECLINMLAFQDLDSCLQFLERNNIAVSVAEKNSIIIDCKANSANVI